MSFSTRLRERREFLNMSRSELASALGVTVSAISNYENGVSSPKEEILYRIFSVLKVDPNYLWQDEVQLASKSFVCSFPEQKFIKKYRTLDEYGKEAVDAVLEVECRRCHQDITEFAAARNGQRARINQVENLDDLLPPEDTSDI